MAALIQAAGPIGQLHYFSREPDFPVGDFNFLDLVDRGLPIPFELVPRRATVKTSSRNKKALKLHDLERYQGQKLLAVSQRLKQLIETLAPGQAEFLELDIRLETGKPAASTPYYFVNFLRRLSSIVWERSDFSVSASADSGGRISVGQPLSLEQARITVSRAADPSAEIWHDEAYGSEVGALIFVSDKVLAALLDAKITGLWYRKVSDETV